MKKYIALALMFYATLLPWTVGAATRARFSDLILEGKLWVDVRAYMDGKSGRPTLAEWEEDNTIDVTSVWQAALDSGKPIKVPAGHYTITSSITKTGSSDSIIIDADPGAVFDASTSASTYAITVGGSLGDNLAINDNIVKGARSFTTDLASSLSEGDIVLLTTRNASPADLWNQSRRYYWRGEFVTVASVSGTSINTVSQIEDNYFTASTNVYSLVMPKVEIRNLEIRRNSNQGSLWITYARDIILENNKITGARNLGFYLYYVCGGMVSNNYTSDMFWAGTGESYGLSLATVQNMTVVGNKFYGAKHSISLGGWEPGRHITIIGNDLASDNNAITPALDSHENTEYIIVANNSVRGGLTWAGKNAIITNNIFRTSSPWLAGGMFQLSFPDTEYLKIEGNVFEGNTGLLLRPYLANAKVSYLSINNNYIKSTLSQGLAIYPASSRMTGFRINNLDISGNTIIGGASYAFVVTNDNVATIKFDKVRFNNNTVISGSYSPYYWNNDSTGILWMRDNYSLSKRLDGPLNIVLGFDNLYIEGNTFDLDNEIATAYGNYYMTSGEIKYINNRSVRDRLNGGFRAPLAAKILYRDNICDGCTNTPEFGSASVAEYYSKTGTRITHSAAIPTDNTCVNGDISWNSGTDNVLGWKCVSGAWKSMTVTLAP